MVSGVVSVAIPGNPCYDPEGRPSGPKDHLALSSFVLGPENSLAPSVLQSFLENESTPYNPLVLHGPPGVGKTHLAQGIARRNSQDRNPLEKRVIYLAAQEFAREFAAASRQGSLLEFRAKYRRTNLLVIESIEQLTSRPAAQWEFLYTLDALRRTGGRVMVTCRPRLPDISKLLPALRSRLSTGMVLRLSPPGMAARREILRHAATALNVNVRDPIIRLLATNLPVAAPKLLDTLRELAKPNGHIESDAAKCYLQQLSSVPTTIDQIVSLTAKLYAVKPAQLRGLSRKRSVVLARGTAMYLARTLTNLSLQQIGKHFGQRDHSTVLHNFRKIERLLQTDTAIQQKISELQRTCCT